MFTVTISFILVFTQIQSYTYILCYLYICIRSLFMLLYKKVYISQLNSHLFCLCTCACFSDPWIGLLRAQVFPHHLLQWAHEHWNEAVDVAGIVAAGRLQDHQCSWKKNVGEGGWWWEKGNTIIWWETLTSVGQSNTHTRTVSLCSFTRHDKDFLFFLKGNLTKVLVSQRQRWVWVMPPSAVAPWSGDKC